MTVNRLSRREFLILGRTVVGVSLLAACAPVQPGATTSGGNAAAPANEPVTIRYGRHDPGDGAQVTIKDFEAANPNIKVEMEQIMDFPTKIPALAAAGTLPDVVRSWEAMLFEMVRGGQFIDLKPFIEAQTDFHPEDFFEAHWN